MHSLGLTPSWQLDEGDPLHGHLAEIVLPRVGVKVTDPHFEVGCLSNSQAVYLYQEHHSHSLLVCKFFGSRRQLSEEQRRDVLNHEWTNLSMTREKGFCTRPHRVVRPLSKDEDIDYVLVEDFARGHDLDYYIARAAHGGLHKQLFRKLTELAHFLANLHNRTTGTAPVDFAEASSFFQSLVDSLAADGLIDAGAVSRLRSLCDAWVSADEMWADVSVLVHGDATPTNFIFHPEDGVTAIDLERMRPADRMYDVSALAAELKHHFAWRIVQADAAEPFIRHFLRAYCEYFPNPDSIFDLVARRNQFYMALGELRIACNVWLPWEHRKWLTDEACRCLQF